MKKITIMSDYGIQFLTRGEGLVTKPFKDAVEFPPLG